MDRMTDEPKHICMTFKQQVDQLKDQLAFYYPDNKSGVWYEMSWQTYWERVASVSGWLKAQGVGKGDSVAIISANRPEWIISDLAIMSIGAISVPIYPTLLAKDIEYIIDHSETTIIFTDTQESAELLKNTVAQKIILFDRPSGNSDAFNWISLQEVLGSGVKKIEQPLAMDDSDVATIIYTSGTTGIPKGVVHTHGNFKHAMKVVLGVLNSQKKGVDRFFSFLPLSHVAERLLVEMGSIYTGSEVTFARSMNTIAEDLVICRPTILLCVPRLWEKIYEKIQLGLRTASPVKKNVFSLAKTLGSIRLDGEHVYKDRSKATVAKISDALVGRKIRTKLGMDRVRMALTGSAPTRPDVMKFFASFGLCIREVYGLTENICLGVLNDEEHMIVGSCGKAFEGNEIKIADDGEILFRAPWNFIEYYKNPEATAEAISSDGWFATGDLGQIDDQGWLRIVGRKKELLKTSGGKYVAPVPIEDVIKAHRFIGEAMVIGETQKYCVALVAFDVEAIDGIDPKILNEELEQLLVELNKNLASYETIKRLGVMIEGFSVESGTLTPTMKVKRKVAAEKMSEFIAALYSSSNSVVYEQ
jgi:long-chain acyl-CoA synthetase